MLKLPFSFYRSPDGDGGGGAAAAVAASPADRGASAAGGDGDGGDPPPPEPAAPIQSVPVVRDRSGAFIFPEGHKPAEVKPKEPVEEEKKPDPATGNEPAKEAPAASGAGGTQTPPAFDPATHLADAAAADKAVQHLTGGAFSTVKEMAAAVDFASRLKLSPEEQTLLTAHRSGMGAEQFQHLTTTDWTKAEPLDTLRAGFGLRNRDERDPKVLDRLWNRHVQQNYPNLAPFLKSEGGLEAAKEDEEAMADLAVMRRDARNEVAKIGEEVTKLTATTLVPAPADKAQEDHNLTAFIEAVTAHKSKLNSLAYTVTAGTKESPLSIPVSVDILENLPKGMDPVELMTNPVRQFKQAIAGFQNADKTYNPQAVADFTVWNTPELRNRVLSALANQAIAQGRALEFDRLKAGGEGSVASQSKSGGGGASTFEQVQKASAAAHQNRSGGPSPN